MKRMNSGDSWFSQTFEFGGLAEVFQNSLLLRQDVRLLFRQAARRIAAVAIGAAEHDVRRRVHRLDAGVALIAADAFRVGLRLGLVDPVALRGSGGTGDRERRERRRWGA